MKHIKKIDELFKSTLLSAHDKLKELHPTRASKLKDWADEKGESEFSKPDIDRIYPYKFVLSNNSGLSDVKEEFLGSFTITNIEEVGNLRPGFYGVMVFVMNEFGQKALIRFIFTSNGLVNFKIRFGPEYKYERNFMFENRKDALQFKKFLVEELSDLNIDDVEYVKSISINQLFTTK